MCYCQYRERSGRRTTRHLVESTSSGIRAKVVHGTVLIKMSTSVNKGDEVATDSEEIVRPVYADDIPQNIRDGFDHTCNYIKQCHDALGKRIDVLITRFDGLADIINMPATNSAPP